MLWKSGNILHCIIFSCFISIRCISLYLHSWVRFIYDFTVNTSRNDKEWSATDDYIDDDETTTTGRNNAVRTKHNKNTKTRHQRVSIKHTIKCSQSHTGRMDGKQRTFLWIFGSHDLCMFQNVFFFFSLLYRNAQCIWLDNQSLMIVHFAV